MILRHDFYRRLECVRDRVLFGLAGQEDRTFVASQGFKATRLYHGIFLPNSGKPSGAVKDVDVLFNASFEDMERKRHDFFLKLLAAPEFANVRALAIGRGTGQAVERFKAMARELGVHGRLECLANLPRKDVPAVLARARTGLVASLHENGPRCLYEFFMAGVPVAVTSYTAGIDFSWLSPQTGVVASAIELPEAIAALLERSPACDPRAALLAN